MATLSFVKVNDFVEDAGNKVHDLSNDQLVIALSNTAPSAESSDPTADGNGVLANVTEIAYTNLSTRNLTTNGWDLSSGTASLNLANLTLDASGGAVATFRYIYIYNDTATSDNLIGHYDAGVGITLADGNAYVLDFNQVNGTITLN